MRTFLVAALLAAAVLLGPLAVSATAQEYPCAEESTYAYEYGWYGHHHVDTYGGRPYYFHNPYGHSAHYRR
jgi:hypothetical protein